jgi:hypothetical protein
MANVHAVMYGWGPGSETDRQSFPIPAASSGGAEGLGDYTALGPLLPPPPGPRAADVFAANTHAPYFPPHDTSWPEPQPSYIGSEG